jgi:hypothetical protein
MGKQLTRKRPTIHSVQKDQRKKDEHQDCATPGCRNVVAIWSKYKTCSLCRS